MNKYSSDHPVIIYILRSPGSVLRFAVVDKTHLLCNKCNKCNKKIVGYYNYILRIIFIGSFKCILNGSEK